MTGLLLRFLLILVALWLLRRFLGSLMGEPLYRQNRSKTTAAVPSRMVKDPVCGMYMDARLAVEVQNKGGYFYFCSDERRNKFLAKPR
jgi:YHS domain-containing protein